MPEQRRSALVTGGSRGIGRAIALALADRGFDVALTYAASRDAADEVAAAVRSRGVAAHAIELKLEDPASIDAAFAAAEKALGKIDVLVNNAAIADRGAFDVLSLERWDAMYAANLRAVVQACRLTLPGMTTRGWGRVINMSSIGGQWGGVFQPHYATMKAAVIGLTRSLAKSHGPHGITVNAISPGTIDTDMVAPELAGDGLARAVASIPARRIGKPEEIAASVVFLASNEAGYVNGQTINVNGGAYFG
ncbi:3-oxoacyl-ACP reductase family protein [Roseiterribacter gracilis]|uniref:Beta-ketoacyl-ACP reductase n=1 Tax=Roseiterribacter gracilis TaxID=2812848 RepID=A0A8S8XIJ8_9PROT|nr:beta-ketoacyl-ACP reductase [Rhodospirillales bacterium TMPK1]